MTQFRQAAQADIDSIVQIYDAIHTAEEEGSAVIGWQRSIYPVRKTAEDALSRGDLYVAEDAGKVIASGIINQIQVPEYADCDWGYPADEQQIMVLHTLTVHPSAGGKGTGAGFVAFYEQLAREHGCLNLRMDTNVNNAKARRFYKRLGYREAGIVSCVFNGIPGVQLVCLEKQLRTKSYSFFGWQTANARPAANLTAIHDPVDLYDVLSKVWCAETCAPRMRDQWSPENRTLGQCSITAFLAQDLFGGKVYGIPLPDGSFHCYNVVGDCLFDLTSEQFGADAAKLSYEKNPEQFREVHFAKEEKRLRYEKLKAMLQYSPKSISPK